MIQGNLEYLISSLPYLSFQDTEEERRRVASIFERYAGPAAQEKGTLAIFEDEAGKFLAPDDFQTLKGIRLEDIHRPYFRKSKNKVLATFSGYAYGLKEDIRHLRLARKFNLEGSVHRKTSLPLIPGNPLEEEIQFMKWKWDALEELSIGHYADFGALCIYKLKLLLLMRWWGFDRKKGFEKFLESLR
jgi:hypothetical protein